LIKFSLYLNFFNVYLWKGSIVKHHQDRARRASSLRYKVLHPDGCWQTFRLPLCFSPRDVAERLLHSAIFVYVTRDRNIWLGDKRCWGPVWALYSARHNAYVLAERKDPESLSDTELMEAIR